MMHLSWYDSAWADYLWWQIQDKKTLRRIKRKTRPHVENRVGDT